jgi:pyridoxine 5-phosphate synthase
MTNDLRLHLALEAAAAFRRQGMGGGPNTVRLALLAELAGVDWIGYDLRGPDREDAERDVRLLRACIEGRLNVAMAPGPEVLEVAFNVRPDRVTLVPERREGGAKLAGLDARLLKDALRKQILHLREADIEVGVQIEPDLEQVKALHRSEAQVAVLYTGAWVRASTEADRGAERRRLVDATDLAARLKMRVAMIGGLDLASVEALASSANLSELHVGHACLARGLALGVERAVSDFQAALRRGRASQG